uniref:Uncharacterized protein LOC114334347 n=1 Tax=Diabrotica virgifera virgifera TaxID=50390 RepID=A0A6P7G6N2_DIAVI
MDQLNLLLYTNAVSPPWTTHPLTIDLTLRKYPKSNTNFSIIKNLFAEIISYYPNHLHIFTDASKTPDGHAAAYYSDENSNSTQLPSTCSILTGETTAILNALTFLKSSNTMKCVIITDSLNALLKLKQIYTTNPIIQAVKNELKTLHSMGKNIAFIWVP